MHHEFGSARPCGIGAAVVDPFPKGGASNRCRSLEDRTSPDLTDLSLQVSAGRISFMSSRDGGNASIGHPLMKGSAGHLAPAPRTITSTVFKAM